MEFSTINTLGFTGGLNSALRSSELLQEQFDFCFILPAGSKSSGLVREKGFDVYELPMKEIRKNLLSLLIYLPFLIVNAIRFTRLVRSAKVDLIISNDFYNLLPPVYKLAGGNVPYVCYIRFIPSRFPVLLSRIWFLLHEHFASSIIAVSNVVRDELPRQRKVVVIGNELPLQEVEFIAPSSKLILYPANYIDGKGHQYALQSFADVHSRYPQWKLRFIGGDMGLKKNALFKKRLVEHSFQLGLADCVQWGGFSDRIDQEYLNTSIVLNFSESESFSLTCLEAMFYGRPVIATRSGGPQEIIVHEKNGLLVNVKDVPSMIRALEELIGEPEKRSAMAYQAYLQVRDQYSLNRIKGLLSTTYRDALNLK